MRTTSRGSVRMPVRPGRPLDDRVARAGQQPRGQRGLDIGHDLAFGDGLGDGLGDQGSDRGVERPPAGQRPPPDLSVSPDPQQRDVGQLTSQHLDLHGRRSRWGVRYLPAQRCARWAWTWMGAAPSASEPADRI
jgi:hypothetical protein